jgi:hypothetical protein
MIHLGERWRFAMSVPVATSHFIERAPCPNHEGCVGSQPATLASRFSTSSGTLPRKESQDAMNLYEAYQNLHPTEIEDGLKVYVANLGGGA